MYCLLVINLIETIKCVEVSKIMSNVQGYQKAQEHLEEIVANNDELFEQQFLPFA